MTILEALCAKARSSRTRIVMSEGEDPRVQEAVIRAKEDDLCEPILVGSKKAIAEALRSRSKDPGDFEIIDPAESPMLDAYGDAYFELRKNKGLERAAAYEAVSDPLVYAALMVRQGDADGTIGGAVNTTGDTLRAALQVIGSEEGMRTVSSFFLMVLDQPHHPKSQVLAFADCALIVDPAAQQLAQIAQSTADSFRALTDETPRVAMLSFSTMGSASHARVDKVVEATALLKGKRPDLMVDGELQFDAAFVPDVAASKAPDATSKGEANVFVFPSLEAGNIGYKIAQRIGKATAIGPILQGLAHPANDLSRGCSVDDIYQLIAVTACQAIAQKEA